MNYCISNPSPALSKYIKHYWTLENCLPAGKEHIQRIVPNGLLELIFYLGDRPVSMDLNRPIESNSLVTGHLNGFYDLKISGNLSLFSVLFLPHGLSLFLDIPVSELNNQNVSLEHIFKNQRAELETRLFDADSFSERIQIIERSLLNLLIKNGNRHYYDRIENSIHTINKKKGVVSINDLASDACYSRKQFERIFTRFIGTSPKKFLKTIRFQHAIEKRSQENSANSLTDLTYSCGYYDQSHMINDFQKLTGLTPKKYFEASEPYSDYFQ